MKQKESLYCLLTLNFRTSYYTKANYKNYYKNYYHLMFVSNNYPVKFKPHSIPIFCHKVFKL